MNKIALWIGVRADDWTAELAVIASNNSKNLRNLQHPSGSSVNSAFSMRSENSTTMVYDKIFGSINK